MSRATPEVRSAQARVAALRRDAPTVPSVSGTQAPMARSYSGLVTRAIAFAIDAAIVNGCGLVVGVTVGLGLSILHLPKDTDTVIAAIMAGLFVIWSVAYFTFFWSTTGQTPGDRVMSIKVIDSRGRGPLKPLRAVARFGAVILAAIPLLAGLLIMLWDDRRRCLQDRLTRTVVVHMPGSGAGERRF